MESKELRRRVLRIERLAAMPQVALQLISILGDDSTTIGQLERMIESDIALTSKVLGLANSAYYGMPQKITTINRAVVIIGFNELRLLVLGAGLFKVFDVSQAPAGFDGEGLWRHSLGVSWMARELAATSGHAQPGEVMTGGLLHDLGKFVLATYLADQYAEVLGRTAEGTPYFLAEEELSLRHDTIGFWLADSWGLPPVHQAAIRDHHQPKPNDPNYTAACLIQLADILVKKLAVGLCHKSRPADMTALLEAVNLDEATVRNIYQSASAQLPEAIDNWVNVFGLQESAGDRQDRTG